MLAERSQMPEASMFAIVYVSCQLTHKELEEGNRDHNLFLGRLRKGTGSTVLHTLVSL